MFITSQYRAHGPVAAGSHDAQRLWLLTAATCGAEAGEVSMLVLPARSTGAATAGPGETAAVLVSGSLELAGAGVSAGTVILAGSGAATVLQTNDQPVCLLTFHTASAEHSANRTGRTPTVSLDEVPESPAHDPARGFHRMTARLLVTDTPETPSTLLLGLGGFAPGEGCHALHRHPHAEEVFYIWQGRGEHLAADGTGHPVIAGDLIHVPRGEWHGFRNTGTAPVLAFFAYLGVGTLAAAGYELALQPCSLPE